jgi:flagellar basal-body rod modification protein FlgD
MATVSSVTSTADSSSLAASSAKELSDRFLTMLTAQMRNQDPLNPLDNAELTSQMAQISTVTGISQLNTTMQWLGYNMSALQSTQATSLIGRQVLVSGDVMSLADSKASGGYTLSLPVESAEVRIYDAQKTEVGRINLGAKAAGTYTFDWDGKSASGSALADGNYTFEVVVGSGTDTGVAPTLSTVTIASVRPSASGTVVVDNKGNAINLSDVYQVW